jgi:hypothetical protein
MPKDRCFQFFRTHRERYRSLKERNMCLSCNTQAVMLPALGVVEQVAVQVLPREVAIGVRSKPVVQTSNIFSVIIYKPFAFIKF